jgi:cell division protein FtsB
MPDGYFEGQRDSNRGGRAERPYPFAERAVEWLLRVWRPAGSVLAVALALLLTWHVINGKHGVSVWQQKRVEDRQLRKEIDDLQQENGRLHDRIQKLKTDPHAIEREARERLHYAKPGEVIYALPPDPPPPTQPAGK